MTAFLVLTLLAGCSSLPVRVVHDAPYARGMQPAPTRTELAADIYAPTIPWTWPVVVFAHGLGGEKAQFEELGRAIAERGVVVFVIDWPALDSPAAYPQDGRGYRENYEALSCAVRFARATVSELGGDDRRVTMAGHSLGAGGAAITGQGRDDLDRLWDEFASVRGGPPRQLECAASGVSGQVDAVVGVAGAFDTFFLEIDGFYGSEWLRERDPQLWELLSGAWDANPGPMIRLIYGERDEEYGSESIALHSALVRLGYDVELIPWEGAHSVPLELTVDTIMEVARD